MKSANFYQQGAALVVALMVLLVMTIIGTSGIRHALMDLDSSNRLNDYDLAFQSAESGLRLAESIIQNSTSEKTLVDNLLASGIVMKSSNASDYANDNWWNELSATNTYSNVIVVVDKYQSIPDSLSMSLNMSSNQGITYYKIIARGIDPEYQAYIASLPENLDVAGGMVILKSIYAKRF